MTDFPNDPNLANEFLNELLNAMRTRARRDEKKAAEESAKPPKKSQSTELVELAGQASVELWHDRDGRGYATIPAAGHSEHHPLRTKAFRTWLRRLYFTKHGKTPGSQAVQDAVETLEGEAVFEGGEHETHVRIAGDDETIWVDLCNPRWEAVEVTASGWKVVADPPVKFRRRRGMQPLPTPTRGGSLDGLWEFVNVDPQDRPLVAGFAVKCFRPSGPYPVLNLLGEPGATKTTTGRVLRRLVDPNDADLRGTPKESRDLMIAASNGWLVGFDNVSRVQPWLSDDLCRLTYGAGFATRELHTDDEEIIFSACRPVIITAVGDVATASDLLDRSVLVYLPEVAEEKRRGDTKFWEAFDEAAPGILGALLDAVSCAIRRLPGTHLERLPRMAEFALWATAAEPAFGLDKTFADSYRANRSMGGEVALESSPIGPKLRDLIVERKTFRGTAGQLRTALNETLDDSKRPPDGWPANSNALVAELKRIAKPLRANGITVAYDSRKSHGIWILTFVEGGDDQNGGSDPGPEQEHDENKGGRGSQGSQGRKTAGQTGFEGHDPHATSATPNGESRDQNATSATLNGQGHDRVAFQNGPLTSDDATSATSATSTPPQSKCAVCGGRGVLHPHPDGVLLHLMCADRYPAEATLPF